MPDLLLGVDVGTSTTKGVLCTPGGTVVASARATHAVITPRPGWYEQDADRVWWSGFCKITQRLLQEQNVAASEVAAVGCSAMTPNMLPLDSGGDPLRTAILYCDNRATEIYPTILARVSEDMIFATSGFRLTAHGGWQGGQLLWMREHQPQLYARASRIVSTTGYLVYRLTGESAVDYATARCNVPFYDRNRRGWSTEICSLMGVPVGMFPDRIGLPTEIAGRVTAAAARACGLREGTPVTIGTIDTNADMLAAGVTEPGDVGLVYGTSLIAAKCVAEPVEDRNGLANHFAIPGLFLCGTGVQTAGALTAWFRDLVRSAGWSGPAQSGAVSLEQLGELAVAVRAGAEDLLVVPMLAGDEHIVNGSLAAGAILGLTTYHRAAHLYRALLEGTAYELRRQLMKLAPCVPVTGVSSVGGGTRSMIWTQVVSDVLNVRQRCFADNLGAPFGDAFLAGLGVGLLSGFEVLPTCWLRGPRAVTPLPENRAAYDDMYQRYLDLLVLLGLAESRSQGA